jgi:hypothetical protein
LQERKVKEEGSGTRRRRWKERCREEKIKNWNRQQRKVKAKQE